MTNKLQIELNQLNDQILAQDNAIIKAKDLLHIATEEQNKISKEILVQVATDPNLPNEWRRKGSLEHHTLTNSRLNELTVQIRELKTQIAILQAEREHLYRSWQTTTGSYRASLRKV